MNILVSAIGQGLLWATLGIGLFLTFRILDFPDMTVEGTFPLGAATAVTLISNGMNPGLASLIAAGAGALAGLVTGLIYTKGKVPILLAGILTMTAVYSINLRIMGQANRSLLGKGTLFSADFLDFLPKNFPTVVVGLVIIVVVTAATAIFLQTELGQAFIVTGDNRAMARSLGVNTDNMTIMGLMISNGLIGLGGALVAQNNGFADVNMGIGIIVVALASIIIGEVVFTDQMSLTDRLVTIVIGSVLYRFVLVIVLYLGFNANDLNLFSAVVLGIALTLPQLRKVLKLDSVLKKGLPHMTKTSLRLENATVVVNQGTPEEKTILNNVSLTLNEGDFVTVLGSNGAGKSTLFNVIAGSLALTSGHIYLGDEDVTRLSETQRTKFLARVFQDPKLGTAPRMTVAENLLFAERRGLSRRLKGRGLTKEKMADFAKVAATMGNGLDSRLNVATGDLSGGQRQALSFLMATRLRPELLLLDEHTAALDPKTSEQLMAVTDERIREDHLTALMITHHLEDAIQYGNRLIIMSAGQISLDVSGEEKQQLTVPDLLGYFNRY